MKPPSALSDTVSSTDLGLKFWLSCLVAEALLFGLAFSTVSSKELPTTPPVSKVALIATKSLNAMAQDAMPDKPLPVDIGSSRQVQISSTFFACCPTYDQ